MATVFGVERSRLVWWTIGVALGGVVAFVVYSFLGTFVFGVFLYYATRPVYRRIRGYVGPPSLAAGVSLLALALPALLLLAYTVAIGLQELNGFINRVDLGRLEPVLRPYIDISRIVQDPGTLLAEGGLDAVQAVFQQALGYVGTLGQAALHLFVIIGIAFYLLRDDGRLAAWFHRRFDDPRGVLDVYVQRVDRDFNNIFFGNILNAVLTAIIGAIAYNALAAVAPPGLTIPYPTLLGLLTGVASLIPVVGMKLVYVPVTAYLGVTGWMEAPELLWFPAVFAGISLVVVDVIPDLVLRPYVSGRGLHIGMVMFAYIFGPLLWGWYGIFLGPMLLVLVVHFVKLVLPELLAGKPIEPTAIGPDLGDASPVEAGDAVEDATARSQAVDGDADGAATADGREAADPDDTQADGDEPTD